MSKAEGKRRHLQVLAGMESQQQQASDDSISDTLSQPSGINSDVEEIDLHFPCALDDIDEAALHQCHRHRGKFWIQDTQNSSSSSPRLVSPTRSDQVPRHGPTRDEPDNSRSTPVDGEDDPAWIAELAYQDYQRKKITLTHPHQQSPHNHTPNPASHMPTTPSQSSSSQPLPISSASASRPTTPVSAAWLAMGDWALGMGSSSVGLTTRLAKTIGRRSVKLSSSLLSKPRSLPFLSKPSGGGNSATSNVNNNEDRSRSDESSPIDSDFGFFTDPLGEEQLQECDLAPSSCALSDEKLYEETIGIIEAETPMMPIVTSAAHKPTQLADLPLEILLNIFQDLPTSTLSGLLRGASSIRITCVMLLSARTHGISSLADLKAFSLNDPRPLPPWPRRKQSQDILPGSMCLLSDFQNPKLSHSAVSPLSQVTQSSAANKHAIANIATSLFFRHSKNSWIPLPFTAGVASSKAGGGISTFPHSPGLTTSSKSFTAKPLKIQQPKQSQTTTTLDQDRHAKAIMGPLFYRSGTMLLFARHFTRLIPEARVFLGVGYAVVLAWFMCLFYALPFFGALFLYFAMDVVDAISRMITVSLQKMSPNVLRWILRPSHPLHPTHPGEKLRVPTSLVERLHFAAPAPIAAPAEPARCCGPAGTAWEDDTEPDALSTHELKDLLQSAQAQFPNNSNNTNNNTQQIPMQHQAVAAAALAAAAAQANLSQSQQQPQQPNSWGLMSPYTPWHLYLLTLTLSTYAPHARRLTLSRVSLAWWFRLHPCETLKVLILSGCEVDETGVGLVAKACTRLLGLVVRGSEVRGGGWDVDGLRRPKATVVAGVGVVEEEEDSTDARLHVRGWWADSISSSAISSSADAGSSSSPLSLSASLSAPSTPARSSSSAASVGFGKRPPPTPPTSRFESLRMARFEMCAAACALDSVRMVLDRCPRVERVEFVSSGVEEEGFLEALGMVEMEVTDEALAEASAARWIEEKQAGEEKVRVPEWVQGKSRWPWPWLTREGSMWWEARGVDVSGDLDLMIRQTQTWVDERDKEALLAPPSSPITPPPSSPLSSPPHMPAMVLRQRVGSAQPPRVRTFSVGLAVPPPPKRVPVNEITHAPAGLRKCIVIQGKALRGFRNLWYAHLVARQQGLWGQDVA